MAAKGWTARVATAAGVAAGTGAAQLGLGYGLGVVVWPAGIADDDSVWLGSLGWATWIAASATVFGAVVAARLGRPLGGPWRFALAASAAVGALLTVALIALPARAAVRADTFSPETVAGGYAVIGVLLGLAIAYWAVVSRPVAANLIATAGWLWALAVAAIVADVFWHRPTATYLSSWQFAAADGGAHGTIHWPSALLTLLAAFVIGVLGAAPSARRGDLGAGAATSGAVGPLLVAAAFFVLAPKLTPALGALGSAYLIAPYAVLAGLAGSAATIALAQQRATRRATRAATPQADASPSSGPQADASPSSGPQADASPSSGPQAGGSPSSGSPSGESRSGGSQASGSSGSRWGGRGRGISAKGDPGAGRPRKGGRGKDAGAGVASGPALGREEAGGSGAGESVAVPAPRAPRASSSPETATRAGAVATETPAEGESPAGRQRPSLFRRMRRGRDAAAPPVDPGSVATGRAQAPAPARSAPPVPPAPSQGPAPQPSQRQASAPQPPPRQTSAPQSPPRQASAPPPRPSSAPQRETVARPPANPAVAKINPVAEGTASGQPKASPVQKTAPAQKAAPAKAAPAEKAPGDKPASPQKATPAKKAAPRKAPARSAQPAKPTEATGASGTTPSAGAGPQPKTTPPARASEPPRAGGQGKAGQEPA